MQRSGTTKQSSWIATARFAGLAMTGIRILPALLGLTLALVLPVRAQDTVGEEIVKMEAFNVTAYHGRIPIIDGFTGKDYTGDNDVVFKFAQSFNKLLLG